MTNTVTGADQMHSAALFESKLTTILPTEVVDSPSLEIFKTCLDKILCSLL